MSKARRNKNLSTSAVIELVRKYQETVHTAAGTSLLNSQGLKFDPAFITNGGNDTSLFTLDNATSATQSRWIFNKKCKVHVSSRMFVNDGTSNAYIHIQKNFITIMTSAEISASGTLVHASTELIFNPGDILTIALPLGNASTGNDVFVRILAESLEQFATISSLEET